MWSLCISNYTNKINYKNLYTWKERAVFVILENNSAWATASSWSQSPYCVLCLNFPLKESKVGENCKNTRVSDIWIISWQDRRIYCLLFAKSLDHKYVCLKVTYILGKYFPQCTAENVKVLKLDILTRERHNQLSVCWGSLPGLDTKRGWCRPLL